MSFLRHLKLALCIALFYVIEWACCNELRKQRETSVAKFLKLLFYRLIYGFANMFGMGDFAEEIGDGVLAPPDSDYRQDYIIEDDDDYDDDNKNNDYFNYY